MYQKEQEMEVGMMNRDEAQQKPVEAELSCLSVY